MSKNYKIIVKKYFNYIIGAYEMSFTNRLTVHITLLGGDMGQNGQRAYIIPVLDPLPYNKIVIFRLVRFKSSKKKS